MLILPLQAPISLFQQQTTIDIRGVSKGILRSSPLAKPMVYLVYFILPASRAIAGIAQQIQYKIEGSIRLGKWSAHAAGRLVVCVDVSWALTLV